MTIIRSVGASQYGTSFEWSYIQFFRQSNDNLSLDRKFRCDRRGSSVDSMSASQAAVTRSILASGTFFRGKIISSADSRRAICQILAKEWALNTGKLPPIGLRRNRLVK